MNRASIVSENVQSFINQNTPSQDFTGAPSSFASFDVVQPAPIGTPPQVQLLKALGDFYTSDRDKDARKRAMDAFGSSLPSLSDPSTDAFVGRKVVSSAGYVGNPMAFLHDHAQKLGLQMPEGISSDMQAYSLVGNHIRSVALKDYEARLQQQKEVQKAQDKLMEMNGDQWAALINGDEIREKKFFATIGHLDATSQGKWVDTLGKARAAMNIISNWQKEGGMTSDAKSVLGKSFTGLKENMDKADYEQLARAESRRSLYELTAKQYAALFDSLSTTSEDGTKTLDEAALALFRFALSREMRDQQRISGDFWGSFTDGLRGLWNETEDFFRNPDTPLLMQGAVGLATQALQGLDETYIRSNPDYIKLRDIIYNAEDEGTDISKDATFLAQALAKSGNIVGESLPATLAGIGATIATGGLGAAAGLAAWAGAASTIAPSSINAAVRSNIAEGNSNPWLTGVVQGGAQAAAEGIFGIIPGGGKATQFLLRVGAKTPLAGRVLAKAQSNALARFFFSGTTESIGEISEDVIADFGSNLGLNLMREVGIDISAPNADALANLSETLEDPAQITAMVGYCFTLGLVGMGADSVKARTFARNYDNLKAAGFSRENAAYISQRAEEISNRIAEVQANPETSDSAKTTIIDALEKDFQQEQQNLFKKDVLDQDPSVLLKRAKENKKELMSQREAALLTASGARDAALAKMGVLQEPKPLANGKYLLTFQTQKPDGTPEETKVEWTDQQLTDWVQLQNDNIYAAAMRQYQSWLTGAALAQSPLAIKDAEQAKTQLLNLGVAPTAAFNDAFADLAKRGTIDAPFVQKLSNLANAEINSFMEAGMTREQAAQQPSAYIPGVATGTLANLRQATRQRVAAAAQTTEGKTIGITQENATFPAIRLNAIDGGSVVAFIAGDISPLQFSEDMWEAKLVNQVNSGKLTWTQLEDQLKKAEAELRRINPAISILPKKDSLSRQDIIEGYSTLQTADFITNHKHYPLSQNTHTLLDTVIRGSQAVRAAQLIGEAWKNVDKTDIDTSLSDLLRDAGMQMGAIFDSAKVDAQVRQAVWERRGVTESLEQRVQAVIDEYNAEQQEIRDNPPEPAGTPQPIPAEESVTGEAIPAEDPLARADNNPETGDFNIPSMPTQQDERGRGLKDNKYAETGNGSVIGMVDPNTVKPCPEVQQFKTIDTSAGRTEAREDGTVRDLPGKWNPLADPIFILRRKNGELQVISGRHRLAHAKKNGAKYIKAEVWDESEKFDIAWARRQDVAHNILQGTANATDIAVFFRGNPITYEEADALGFIQKRKDGEDTSASKMGITVALHASEEIYTRLINGQISDSTAFQLAALFPDNERQQLEALDLRESGQSWTSIAWYVNSDPDSFIPDGLTQGNLFGVDENEGRKKLAEYVGKVEKHITSLIGIIEKGKSIQRRAKIARELDFNFSTDTDLVDTLTLLRDLKYAYQHPHKGELEDVKRKAEEWDGKSPVEPTLSELIGEAKLLVPYTSEEAAPAEAAESMDDLFSSMAIGTNGDIFFTPLPGEAEAFAKKIEELVNSLPAYDTPEHVALSETGEYRDWSIKVCELPPIFRLLGMPNLSIFGSPYTFDHAMQGSHNVSPEELKRLVQCLYNPIMVLKSSRYTEEKKSLVVVVNMTEYGFDKDLKKMMHKQVLVPLHIEKTKGFGKGKLTVNYMASAYGKDGFGKWLKQQIDADRLLYIGVEADESLLGKKEAGDSDAPIPTVQFLKETQPQPADTNILTKDGLVKEILKKNENASDDASLAIATSNPDDIAAQYANARKGSLAHRMMTHARAEANRFRRVLRKPTTDAEAAQDLASVLIFMESAMRYVPSVHLPRMTAKRNALEAYIKMMQQGRIGVNRNGTIRRSGLTQEQINAVAEQAASAYEEAVARQDILPENKLTKEEAKKLQRDFIRAAARDNIGTTIASIYDDIASSIATALSDKLIDRIEKRIDSIKPRISNNRKPIQAKVAPRAFRDIAEINSFIHLSSTEYEDALDSLIARAASTEERDQGDIAAIEHQIALLKTYGNLKGKSYAEVQAAYTDLMAYIATERHIWQDILEIRDSEMREDMQAFFDKVDAAAGDIYNLDKMRRKADSLTGWASSFLKSMQSPAQLFLALSGHPALKKIAEETLNGISNANVGLLHAESLRENMMLSAFARIIGIKPLGRDGQYSSRQLNHLKNNEFADFTQDLLKTKDTGITRTYLDRKGNEVSSKIVANDGQLLNIILMAEQDHYKPNAEKWGYTKETLDAIKSHLGERKLAFAYALRSILQSDNLPAYFEERTGIVMPENKFYWPGHLSVARLATQESASLLDSSKQGGTYGMLRNRVANNYDFALADIQSVFQAACAQRNNYIHIQPITNKWRRMLHDDQFSKRLEGTIGSHNFMLLKGFLDALDGSGAADGFMAASINNKLAAFLSSYAKNVLAGNPTTLLKQTDAIMHGALMEGTNAAQISKQILLDRLGKGKMNYASIMELPALKNRYRGSSAYEDLIRSGANSSWSKLGNFLRLGMNAIEKVDVVCNTISACALYNVTYERLKSENETAELPMTESEIQIACEQQVTNMLELTAQPLRKTQKSAFVILNNSLLADACTFLGSETLNKIGFAVARATKTFSETGSRAKALGSFMKVMSTMGVASALIGMAIQVLKGTSPGDDADKADWLLYVSQELAIGAAGIDMLSQLPLVGELFNVRYNFSKGWNMPLATECREAFKLVSMAIDDRDHSASEYFNKAHAITRGLATSSGIFAAMQGPLMRPLTVSAALLGSMTTAMNAISPFAKGIEKDAIWAAPLGLESKKQRQARERRRKAILRQLSRSRSTRSVPTRYNLAL